tara:strand:+ start:7 stop:246 length:240 start_codon:yes stop_codon:yes gene_type:complete
MYIVFILIKTKQKMALSKRGLDTMTYIKSIENEDLTGSEKFDLIKEYFDAWEENQIPDGIEIITNSDGLPEIKTKNLGV